MHPNFFFLKNQESKERTPRSWCTHFRPKMYLCRRNVQHYNNDNKTLIVYILIQLYSFIHVSQISEFVHRFRDSHLQSAAYAKPPRESVTESKQIAQLFYRRYHSFIIINIMVFFSISKNQQYWSHVNVSYIWTKMPNRTEFMEKY